MKILIIGGGIGGLTTALVCQHLQLPYELFEAAPSIREVGAGIWVPPNAMQVMKRLGLSDVILQTGSLLDSISVGGPGGEQWYTLPASKVIPKFGFGTVAIHRGRLQSLLLHALDNSKIHTGKRLIRLAQKNDRVTAVFDDGTEAVGDCLIGADGLRSVTRTQLFGELPIRYSGQTCWRGLVKLTLPENSKNNMIELWGNQPGQRFAYSRITDDEIYYYTTAATAAGGKDENNIHDFLHRHYDPFGPVAKKIIDAIAPGTVIRTDLYDLQPISTWTKDRVALLGDAAHATTPNLGQGAAQAIEDAYVLVSLLKNHPDIPEALLHYQQKRIAKAHHIVNTSWRFGQLTNFKNPVAIALRNWAIRATPGFITDRQIEKAYHIDF
jgi:2-polyprenyl-6-methoxyphenol hydroxylase-like FAD-dependent oxidoreductase